MGAVTACAILLGFLSTSWHLAMLSGWLPLVAWTYLAFHAASAVPDESKRVEMLVAGKPSDGRIRTGAAALVLSVLLMLISVLPCLLGAVVAAMSGFPLVSLGILIGGPMLGISLGGLTGFSADPSSGVDLPGCFLRSSAGCFVPYLAANDRARTGPTRGMTPCSLDAKCNWKISPLSCGRRRRRWLRARAVAGFGKSTLIREFSGKAQNPLSPRQRPGHVPEVW
jgi:hypothetical protein